MDVAKIFLFLGYAILFPPIFLLLFFISFAKVGFFSPYVFLIISVGDAFIIIGLLPVHLVWSIYCFIRTKRFAPLTKCLLVLSVPILIAMWAVVGVCGSVVMGIFYAFVWPVMETFRAVSREGVPICMRFIRVFTDGTISNLWGACIILRDFADFSFHSYFSIMDELLESGPEEPIEIEVNKISGWVFAAVAGILVDVPLISLIVLYKAPILLFKGWYRLIQDLIGREGPFLESVCVPFAALWIVLWPVVVLLAVLCGILSSLGFGCYAAVIAYKEHSMKRGLLYVIASVSIFDEYTNDLLYLQEGSCFPRTLETLVFVVGSDSQFISVCGMSCMITIALSMDSEICASVPRYSEKSSAPSSLLHAEGFHERIGIFNSNEPLLRTFSARATALTNAVIWDNFINSCQETGKELVEEQAIGLSDLEAWKQSKNKLVNVGIPAYAYAKCLLRSVRNGSSGFILHDNVEITGLNKPENRVFDWLYEPMCILKEQIKSMKLEETEELYLYKHCLYSGDQTRMTSWQNGGNPPQDEIRRAQLEGVSRRLQGFCVTLSRLPTSRRRFSEVLKTLELEAKKSAGNGKEVEVV